MRSKRVQAESYYNKHISPAHFKTLREALGLSVHDVADMAGITPRAVQHWENGAYVIPDGIYAQLLRIERLLDWEVSKALKQVHDGVDEYRLFRFRDEADLWAAHPDFRGLPVRAHAAFLWRAKRALEKTIAVVRIVYRDPAPL